MLASRVIARSARVAAPRYSLAATRGYAEASKPAANTQPPIEVFGLDGTYATALVRLQTTSMASLNTPTNDGK